MNKKTVLLVLLALFTVACEFLFPGNGPWTNLFRNSKNNFSSNGASIYYTGITLDGRRVDYFGGPFTGMMMDQGLACASCHGDDGSGGRHVMHMQVMEAPDIRLSALGAESHDNSTGQEDHADSHDEGYDLHAFEQAVIYGEHPDGESLSKDMPRWQLSDEDLADLFSFIGSLE